MEPSFILMKNLGCFDSAVCLCYKFLINSKLLAGDNIAFFTIPGELKT